jgi:hypothetical protein
MAKRFFCRRKENKQEVPLEKLQADRIEELKRENNALSIELARYRAKEAEIAETLAYTKNKAKELEREAKVRYTLECERLEAYRAKWTEAVQNLEKAENLGEQVIRTERYLRQCAKELREMIEQDIPFNSPAQEDYISETERLSEKGEHLSGGEMQETLAEEGDMLSDEEIRRLVSQLII